ncbi:MAG: 5-(carboxyamino)imidazole ribonucleotide synthase [Leptospirillia bacterium]
MKSASHRSGVIRPGETLGVLGGGQLGLFFVLSARRMGYRTVVLDPDPSSPAMVAADRSIVSPYDNEESLRDLSDSCAAITTEFENVPARSLEFLSERGTVRPSSASVATCQDRILEKTFLSRHGFPTTPFLLVSREALPSPEEIRGLIPGILKTAREGYDGKGQWPIRNYQELTFLVSRSSNPFVLEKRLDLAREFSLIIVRDIEGKAVTYPVAENHHEEGILHISSVPADIPADLERHIRDIGESIARTLDYTGILAVEYFLDISGNLYVNELAPRPHNSGHYTLDACISSQFDQQVRTLCGLPLASPRLLSPCAMGNLLGHLWTGRETPDFSSILAEPQAKLTLYGKASPRPGRKMGHFTVLGFSAPEAAATVHSLLTGLSLKGSTVSSLRP